jgi:hypothetical protein
VAVDLGDGKTVHVITALAQSRSNYEWVREKLLRLLKAIP